MRRPIWFSTWSLTFVAAWCIAASTGGAELVVRSETIGRSLGGEPIRCDLYGDGDDVLLVIATIHGNESAGTPLVAEFAKWLRAHPQELVGRTVAIMPVANPDGMAKNARFNDNGVDLNRNFPAGNWGAADVKPHGDTPLSEPESRAVMRVLCQFFPDRVVSIHQPLDCVDYDGPAEGLAQAMAAACPLKLEKLGGLPGSLGSFVGETLRRPIVTLELPKDAPHDGPALWKTYGEALVAALRYEAPADEAGRDAASPAQDAP
ncbi:MAG: DUF2817 domain-containing protein [Pirellulales bacterium]|nr:DUF2817 domain-containing protein [Pirellulales bacterium]